MSGSAATGLVLLHGWGMNGAVWADLPAALGKTSGRPVAALDLPGHGHHPLAPTARDLDAWADACLALAPRRAVWLGWSLGGLVAMAAALRAPERITGLILLTATPRFVRAPDWPAAMDKATLEQFHSSLLAEPAVTLDLFLSLQVRGSDAARETLRALRRDLAGHPAPDAAALALGLDLLRDTDLRPRLGELTCPSLWLFGSHDTLVPAAVAEGVAGLLPNARIEVIHGAGHAPFLSHPAETSRPMCAFLEGLDALSNQAEGQA